MQTLMIPLFTPLPSFCQHHSKTLDTCSGEGIFSRHGGGPLEGWWGYTAPGHERLGAIDWRGPVGVVRDHPRGGLAESLSGGSREGGRIEIRYLCDYVLGNPPIRISSRRIANSSGGGAGEIQTALLLPDPGEAFARLRYMNVEALRLIASAFLQECHLFLRLHPFCNHTQVQVVREGNDGLDDRGRLGVMNQVLHK